MLCADLILTKSDGDLSARITYATLEQCFSKWDTRTPRGSPFDRDFQPDLRNGGLMTNRHN